MENSLYLYLCMAFIVGSISGAVLVYIWQMKRVLGLERGNAQFEAQNEAAAQALEKAGEMLDLRFKASAQEAMQKSNEQFLQLAQERLKNAQAGGAHDLEKRQKAIDEMVKPVHEDLKALSMAVEQVKGTNQTLPDMFFDYFFYY